MSAPDVPRPERGSIVREPSPSSQSSRTIRNSSPKLGSPTARDAMILPHSSSVTASSALVTEELLQLAESMRTIVPKGTWQSLGSEAEIAAENAAGVQKRLLTRIQYDVSRTVLLHHHSVHSGFITKEASEDSRDLRATQNALYEVMRDEVDVGVQAVPRHREATSQTHCARKVNAAVQAEPILVDACIRHMEVPRKESPTLTSFLNKVLPRTLHCLTQNYEVPIYTDDYALFKEDDAIVGTRDDMLLVEKGNYTHAATKDRRVTSVDWRCFRSRDDYVCVTSISPSSLEERLEAQRRCEGSVSLVWQFSDPMHPRYILEAPNEVQVLRFSPSRPNLIAGGAMNGQVYLWDLDMAAHLSFLADPANPAGGGGAAGDAATGDAATIAGSGGRGEFKEAGEVHPMPESAKGVVMEKDGDMLVPRLQPIQASRVELSHRRPVHDLQWLPTNLECSFDGKQTVLEDTTSHQFATVSDDGIMHVWDTRPEYLPQDKLRKMKHQSKGGGSDVPWVPLLKYQLTKPDGSGDLMGFRFYFDGVTPDDSPSYTVAVGSTDGELGICGMVTQHGHNISMVVPTFGNTKETRFVRSVVTAHAGPVYCVERHPSIGDVYLTCGDHSFKVWRAGMDLPLYRSPYIESPVTCAAWSPARPAVVFIGTGDGKIEVWDLLDRNNEPLLVHHMVQDAITTISFKRPPRHLSASYMQHMAVGTNLGSFHWYVLPSALSRAPNGERRNFRKMLGREVRRVAYYSWRWVERRGELERYGAAAPMMVISSKSTKAGGGGHRDDAAGASGRGGTGAGADDDDDFDNVYAHDPQRDAEFLERLEALCKQEEDSIMAEAVD